MPQRNFEILAISNDYREIVNDTEEIQRMFSDFSAPLHENRM